MKRLLTLGDFKVKQFTCPYCYTVFAADISEYWYEELEYNHTRLTGVECPFCKKSKLYFPKDVEDYELQPDDKWSSLRKEMNLALIGGLYEG